MGTATTTRESRADTRPVIVAILAISAAASLFLFWLIYRHPAADTSSVSLPCLPARKAIVDALLATALLVRVNLIRVRTVAAPRASLTAAFMFTQAFVYSYIVHHYLHRVV